METGIPNGYDITWMLRDKGWKQSYSRDKPGAIASYVDLIHPGYNVMMLSIIASLSTM